MTAQAWDYLPPDWAVRVEKVDPPEPINPKYPLASKGGINALSNILQADAIWRALTKPQRELLLSAAAGAPIAARRDVLKRMTDRGLLEPYWWDDMSHIEPTDAGRFVVQWRLP